MTIDRQQRGDAISDPALFPSPIPDSEAAAGNRRKLWLGLAMMATLVLVWLPYQWYRPSPPIVVSRQTTYLTEPLAADGLPDYRTVRLQRQGQGVSPEDNAAVPFWRAMGPYLWEPPAWAALERRRVPHRSGLDHGSAGPVCLAANCR